MFIYTYKIYKHKINFNKFSSYIIAGMFILSSYFVGQLLSKTRFLSSQLDAYITDGLWLRNATHANDMARKLSEKLSKINSFELTYPTESNEIFIKMPKNIQDHLNNEGYSAIPDDMFDGSVRFVTAWNTNLNDIENLINTIKEKL